LNIDDRSKELFIKNVRSQEWFVQFGHFADKWGGSSDWTSALFDAKNSGFFEIYGVFARTRRKGVEPVLTFFGQEGRGQFIAISFMDGP